MVPAHGTMRAGAGTGYSDCCGLSGWGAPIPCGIFAVWLRLRLPAQIGKEVPMKIVVVKSPKFLNGILRKLFGIKD